MQPWARCMVGLVVRTSWFLWVSPFGKVESEVSCASHENCNCDCFQVQLAVRLTLLSRTASPCFAWFPKSSSAFSILSKDWLGVPIWGILPQPSLEGALVHFVAGFFHRIKWIHVACFEIVQPTRCLTSLSILTNPYMSHSQPTIFHGQTRQAWRTRASQLAFASAPYSECPCHYPAIPESSKGLPVNSIQLVSISKLYVRNGPKPAFGGKSVHFLSRTKH